MDRSNFITELLADAMASSFHVFASHLSQFILTYAHDEV
jgi:hypothetical protein